MKVSFVENESKKVESLSSQQKNQCVREHLWCVSEIWASLTNRVCHGFRLTKHDDYFRVNFDHF